MYGLDKLIVALYTGDTASDAMIWHREMGLLIELGSLSHGAKVWAEFEGSKKFLHLGHEGRLPIFFDGQSSEFLWPEQFSLPKGSRRKSVA